MPNDVLLFQSQYVDWFVYAFYQNIIWLVATYIGVKHFSWLGHWHPGHGWMNTSHIVLCIAGIHIVQIHSNSITVRSRQYGFKYIFPFVFIGGVTTMGIEIVIVIPLSQTPMDQWTLEVRKVCSLQCKHTPDLISVTHRNHFTQCLSLNGPSTILNVDGMLVVFFISRW